MYVYWQRASILRHNIVCCPLCNRQHSNHGEWKLNTQRNAKPRREKGASAWPKLVKQHSSKIDKDGGHKSHDL